MSGGSFTNPERYLASASLMDNILFGRIVTGQAGAVKATLGPLVSVANPLDYHTFIWGDRARMAGTYAPIYWLMIVCNLVVPQVFWSRRASQA